jgi:hypothetical protein
VSTIYCATWRHTVGGAERINNIDRSINAENVEFPAS